MPDIYYRLEVKDLRHGIKRWQRIVGYVSFDKEYMLNCLRYFRMGAKVRSQTTGNEYRIVQVNKKTKEELVLDD